MARAAAAREEGTWVRCPLRRIITMILYADDMVAWADSEDKLQRMLTALSERTAAAGLLFSAAKSKLMVSTGWKNAPSCSPSSPSTGPCWRW